MKFADIIIPLAVEGVFTYAIPVALEEKVGEGKLVIVSFAGNKKYTGVVWRIHEKQPVGYKIKNIEAVTDDRLQLSGVHLQFLFWMAEYYMAYPGEVLRAALPVVFRLESFTAVTLGDTEIDFDDLADNGQALLRFLRPGQYVAMREIEKYLGIKNGMGLVKSLLDKGYIQIKETIDEIFREKTEKWILWARPYAEEELSGILDALRRASGQYKMLCRWIEAGKEQMEKQHFLKQSGGSVAILKSLCEKNILKIEERKVSRLGEDKAGEQQANPLSLQQESAIKQIRDYFTSKDCVLLRGVTSSGKTEVYIHLIREYISRGKQVLYMLPEIALTVQIIRRLRRVFGDTIGIYHSGMPDNIRAELWKKQSGPKPYPVILGVRSSLFLPFQKLGLVIVDEEHDPSYKQKEPAPRYHGRDAAIMLANLCGAKVLLGSATPSFESYYNTKTGKYGYVQLTSRYGDIRMPELLLADLAEYRRKKLMKGVFSPVLIQEMQRTLNEGNQIILFQNRRGYSTYLQCDCCGSILKCSHCDVSMTYYKQRDLLSCRYCGSIKRNVSLCTECGKGHYRQKTPGTERVEEEVAALFPDARIARMDLEVMSSKAKYHRVIHDFEEGKTNILVGTQMVSKGLDFANVKLVGVIDADSMVNFPDFRSEERAYCMLMQVGGRSGRKGEQGKVIVQTADPDNRVYRMVMNGDYDVFYTEIAAEREQFVYPPFCRLIQVELRHKEVVVVRNAVNLLVGRLRVELGRRVWGPAVPEVSKIGEMHRVQLLIKIEYKVSLSRIKSFLKEELSALQSDKGFTGLRVYCDVDPQN